MKKNKVIGFIAVILIVGAAVVCIAILSAYEENEKFFHFPIPKNAQIASEDDIANNYSWPPASEEHGIPKHYKMVIKFKGWKEEDREGASTIYIKDGHRIDLISTTEFLTVRKES